MPWQPLRHWHIWSLFDKIINSTCNARLVFLTIDHDFMYTHLCLCYTQIFIWFLILFYQIANTRTTFGSYAMYNVVPFFVWENYTGSNIICSFWCKRTGIYICRWTVFFTLGDSKSILKLVYENYKKTTYFCYL